ncbi:EAL domain-containing protein [Magnetococcus sp. PR-3]|uniref:EAL domain-containing protein n=1 Tax=Magnetococcus sp. PR-3 TaxID=3120355 RepID=UPI002FCE279B
MAVRRSKVMVPLLGGFVVLLTALVGMWGFNYQASEQLFGTMQGSMTTVHKMHIISELMETIRARTRIAAEMLDEEDVFANDGHKMELDALANRFVSLRKELLALPLDTSEKIILNDLSSKVIPPTVKALRQVIEIAMWSEEEEERAIARRQLYDTVQPGQGKVIDHFMRFQTHLETKITKATTATIRSHRTNLQSQLLVLLILLLIMLVTTYITIRRVMTIERTLHYEKERAQITLISIADGVITTDTDGFIQDANKVVGALVGNNPEDLVGKQLEQAFPTSARNEEMASLHEDLNSLLASEIPKPMHTMVVLDSDGDDLLLDATLSPVQSSEGVVLGAIITVKDVTEQQRMSEKIRYQARHDHLTGLFNRHAFADLCRESMDVMKPEETHSLCVIDLDRFKAINDTCGHKAGDMALKQISTMIQGCVRKQDYAARIGGDEFTVFLADCTEADAVKVMEKLLEQVQEYRFLWEGQTFTLGFSIGICEVHQQVPFEKSFQAADSAVFQAKDDGRMCIRTRSVETNALETPPAEETNWVGRLHRVLGDEPLVLVAQPMVAFDQTEQGAPLFEIFMRLPDGEKNHPPNAFLPTAERHGLTGDLDRKVLEMAIEDLKQRDDGRIYSINLSAKTLESTESCDGLFEVLDAQEAWAKQICFELDENTLINNMDQASQFLFGAKQRGAKTALDNYGGSLGNCLYLEQLELDMLKVDGQLVQQAKDKVTTRTVVAAIHNISQSMKIQTVAKHVEDAELASQLNEIGFNYQQGFYHAKPESL